MRFSHKLAAAIVLPTCLALSVGGTWSIHQNFSRALDTAAQVHAADQMNQRYVLEAALSEVGRADSNALFSQMAQYAKRQRQLGKEDNWFVVMGENDAILYSNMPQAISYKSQQDAVAEQEKIVYVLAESKTYQLLCTQMRGLSRPLWLVNAYDVSAQVMERDRQVQQHLMLEGVVLLLAGMAAVIVARRMTKPLRQLEIASQAISQGDLTARTQIQSGDELEHLGNTFNTMAQAVRQQMEALQEETARQKRFVAAFTHELKTPMTAILGYGNLLRSGEQPAEKRHRAAEYIYHESQRLEALSQDLMQLFGLERGGIQLGPVKLSTLWGELRRSLPTLDARLEWEGEEITLFANRTLLVTLLRNLILNAASADTKQGMIHVWCRATQEGIRLGVTDTGPGIPTEECRRIVEPFYRLDKSRSRAGGGNGLGLTICEQIARAHGTQLQIESQLGQGTTVWIPLQEVKE